MSGAFHQPPHFWGVGSDGAIPWLEATGLSLAGEPLYVMRFVTRPADFADYPYQYRLTIAPDGHPLWVRTEDGVPLTGLGTMLGAALGND